MIALIPIALLSASPTPFFWPKPEVVEEIEIPAVVRADGVPVRLHVIRSRLGVQQLLERFGNAFVQAGFYVAKVQKRHIAEPHVTGLDWRGLVSYTAILSPNDDGTTTCLLGEAAVGKKKTAVQAPDFAPLYPAARDVARLDQEGARILSYLVSAKVDDVRAFYRELFAKAGYRPSPDEPGTFERGTERVSLLPRAGEGGTVSVVLVQHP